MKSEMTFYFEASDLKRLIDDNPAYLLISCKIEIGEIDGKKVGVFVVDATSYQIGEIPISTVMGCPVPPCLPRFEAATDQCLAETSELLRTYKSPDFKTTYNIQ